MCFWPRRGNWTSQPTTSLNYCASATASCGRWRQGRDRMVATTRISGQAEATSAPAVELRDVSRQFGGKVALDRISLACPTGCVIGLVGENGAGKTTLIRHVLGLLRAQSGTVRVFGLDP